MAACVAVLTGLALSVVLSTLPQPAMVLEIPGTVPVKAGLAIGASKSMAACTAVLTGLALSAVLSTLPKPTIALLTPVSVPVKAGLA